MANSHLSDTAFAGRAAFLLEAAIAADFTRDGPAVPFRKRPSTFVYFIGPENGPIKIGSAREPYQRLLTLQTGNADELFLYAIADGGFAIESAYHRRFNAFRKRGEWFDLADPIAEEIIRLQQAEIARLTPREPELEK